MTEQPPIPVHEVLKPAVRTWFEGLRDRICAAFETLEDAQDGALRDRAPGRFTRTAWDRPTEDGSDGGGGSLDSARPNPDKSFLNRHRHAPLP